MLQDGRSFGFEPQGEHSFDKASQWLSVNKQKLLEVLSQFGTPTVLGDMGYLGQSLHDRLELKGIDLITPVRKNMKQKKILFP